MTRGAQAEQVRGGVHRVRAVVVVLVKGEQLRRRECLVDADSQCRQLVVDTFHLHVERHRLDRILLLHSTVPISPLRTQLHTAESTRLKGGDRRKG